MSATMAKAAVRLAAKRKLAKKGLALAKKDIQIERSRWSTFGKAVYHMAFEAPSEILKSVVVIVPKFLTLLVRLVRSHETDAKLKLILVGAALTIMAVLGVQVAGLGRWFWFWIITALFGPITGIFAIVAHELINATIVVILVLVTAGICTSMISDEHLRELAIEIWGKKKGTSFVEELAKMSEHFSKLISPLTGTFRKFFSSVGARYMKTGTISALEESIKASAGPAAKMAASVTRNRKPSKKGK